MEVKMKKVNDEDSWQCCQKELTEEMRSEILDQVAEMYREWDTIGAVYGEWSVRTVGEFLWQVTGEEGWPDPACPETYADALENWLTGFLRGRWGDDGYEADVDGNDAILVAQERVFAWIEPMTIEDLLSASPEKAAS
jgi:hypothetical protein